MPTGYRQLTQEDLELVNEIKAQGALLVTLFDKVMKHNEPDGEAKRMASIARTQVQLGFMALVRSVTRPTTFV